MLKENTDFPQPTSNYDDYRQALAEALLQKPHTWAFRHDPRYLRILEHVTSSQALQFLQVAHASYPELWPEISKLLPSIATENDLLGQPLQVNLPVVGKPCSTGNMRYLWHSLLVLQQLVDHNMRHARIIELGGGFGGLALYTHRLAHLFQVTIDNYISVDVPEAAAIQAKFAKYVGFPLTAINGLDLHEVTASIFPDSSQFFVSVYSFAEFDSNTQDWYSRNIVDHCEHGLLVWNFANTWPHRPPNPVYKFTQKELHVEAERPLIDPDNMLVTF